MYTESNINMKGEWQPRLGDDEQRWWIKEWVNINYDNNEHFIWLSNPPSLIHPALQIRFQHTISSRACSAAPFPLPLCTLHDSCGPWQVWFSWIWSELWLKLNWGLCHWLDACFNSSLPSLLSYCTVLHESTPSMIETWTILCDSAKDWVVDLSPKAPSQGTRLPFCPQWDFWHELLVTGLSQQNIAALIATLSNLTGSLSWLMPCCARTWTINQSPRWVNKT